MSQIENKSISIPVVNLRPLNQSLDLPLLFFPVRLKRLISILDKEESQLNNDGKKLLKRCIYSTYMDCKIAGVAELANEILDSHRLKSRQKT